MRDRRPGNTMQIEDLIDRLKALEEKADAVVRATAVTSNLPEILHGMESQLNDGNKNQSIINNNVVKGFEGVAARIGNLEAKLLQALSQTKGELRAAFQHGIASNDDRWTWPWSQKTGLIILSVAALLTLLVGMRLGPKTLTWSQTVCEFQGGQWQKTSTTDGKPAHVCSFGTVDP